MNSSTWENLSRMHQRKLASQSRYTDSLVDKENVEQEVRMPVLAAGRKSIPMQTLNPRGLQEIDNQNCVVPRRRVHLSTDAGTEAMHQRKSASQSRYTDSFVDSLDKENVEQGAKMPVFEAGRKGTPAPSVIRQRKNSDNSYDRPLRQRGLQEIDNLNYVVPRRRIQSSMDADTGAPTYVKSRFTIYGEEESNTDEQNTGKLINARSKPEKFFRPIGPSTSGKNRLCLRKNRGSYESNEKTSSRQSTSGQRSSPADLPNIPKSNVFKIKEEHRRASLLKRKQRQVYDVLSLELAYNIDYMTEYVRFQMEMNDKNRLSSNFPSRGISADQRRLVVKYLVGSTSYYKYPSFISYQAVKIFDYYIDSVNVELQKLQIAALAALWIALKKDLITDDIPDASTLINLAPSVFNGDKKPLIEYERKILIALNFEISFSEPFSMLSLYTVMVEEVRNLESAKVEELYYCGSYLIDLSLLLENMLNISAVHLAAISAEIALVLIMTTDENLKNPRWGHWRKEILSANPILDRYRLPESQMNHIRNQLLQNVIISKDTQTDIHVVYKKYSSKRYGPVSNIMVSKVKNLYLQKITDPMYRYRPIVF